MSRVLAWAHEETHTASESQGNIPPALALYEDSVYILLLSNVINNSLYMNIFSGLYTEIYVYRCICHVEPRQYSAKELQSHLKHSCMRKER